MVLLLNLIVVNFSTHIVLPPGSTIFNSSILTTAGWRDLYPLLPGKPRQPFSLSPMPGGLATQVSWLGQNDLTPYLAGKLVLLHIQRKGKNTDTCIAFRIAGSSGRAGKLESEHISVSHPKPDYLSIVLYSSFLLLVYVTAIMACIFLKRKERKDHLDSEKLANKPWKNLMCHIH